MTSYRDHTSIGGNHSQFPRTEWTKFGHAIHTESLTSELYTRYWKPLYAYLRGRGFSNEEAKDLVQGFFTDKVLGKELFKRADRTKGKLRNFLLTAVKNYAMTKQRGRKPHRGLDHDMDKPVRTGDPETEFNRAWADQLLQRVLKELKQECDRKGKDIHWKLFRQWLVEPDVEPENRRLADISASFGVTNAAQAYNMIANIKERFRFILRNHLRPLVDSDAEVEKEIGSFLNLFSQDMPRSS